VLVIVLRFMISKRESPEPVDLFLFLRFDFLFLGPRNMFKRDEDGERLFAGQRVDVVEELDSISVAARKLVPNGLIVVPKFEVPV